MPTIQVPRGPKQTKKLKPFTETPLDNRIIIQEHEYDAVKERASGILLQNLAIQELKAAHKPFTGTVVAAGPNCVVIKPGDSVRYHARVGEKVTINEIEYLVARETDIYTILNK